MVYPKESLIEDCEKIARGQKYEAISQKRCRVCVVVQRDTQNWLLIASVNSMVCMLGMNKARTKHPLLQILFYSDLNMDLDLVMDLNMVMVVVVDMDRIPSINLVSIVLKI